MSHAMEQQVQRLGDLRRQRQQLEARERELARTVRRRMAEHGLRVVVGGKFEARLVTQENLKVDAAAFHQAVSKRELLESITVSVIAARDLLGDERLREISDVTQNVHLRISARRRRPAASPDSSETEKAAP